ncbi:MAG: hypothetical protein LC749_16460 [Actinobacteria bacterium]|nr:hypothetical protein [Actinomycetota bacterium]
MSYPGGDLRDQLAHVGAEAVRTGLVIGSGGNPSVELAHRRAVNHEEAARSTYAALLTAGRSHRLPQVPARFLRAVGRGEAQV